MTELSRRFQRSPAGFGVHVKFIIPIRNQNGPQTNISS